MKHVTFHLPSFLRRVRIHGGEFDSSARAMNREKQVRLLQAEPRIVRGSTIERKQMSTKTTFKRVALVAVAALGLSLVAVAPSNAYVVAAGFRTLSWASTSATGTVGTEWSAVVKINGACSELFTNSGQVETVTANVTAQLDQAPIGSNILSNSVTWATGTPTGYTNTNANAAIAPYSEESTGYRKTTAVTCIAASTPMVAYATVKFTPDKAGTYLVVLNPLGATTGAITQSITVAAKTLGWNTAFINTTAGSQSVVDATVSVTAAASTTMKARIDVAQGYGTTSGTDTATAADTKEVVVATTKGLVSKTNDYTAGAKSVTTAAGTEAVGDYYVFSNGDVGAASVTVTVGGVLVSTKTVTFTGVAASLSAALTAGQKTWIAPTGTTTVTVTPKDSAGATASNTPTITATPASTAIATATVDGLVVTITGVAAGTTVVTIADAAGVATSTTYTVTVAPAKSASAPTITFGSPSYTVGELVTMTISSGMADSATANLFTTALVYSAGNIVWSGTAGTGATHAISGGKVTYTFYAPAVQGNLTITGTTGADVALTTAAVVTGTVAIANPGLDAATDAANEAYDAANAATDAALAAAEAADAATVAAQEASDAVAALSESVTKLIAGLQAQIKSLAAVVAKIAKKVKA